MENKMIDKNGNFTADYFTYYCTGDKSHQSCETFINVKSRDGLYVRVGTDKKELVILNGTRFDDIDLPTRRLEISLTELSGFKSAEYSTRFKTEAARFPFTETGIKAACEYLRSEAKKRGMVQSNGWPFRMVV
ncbi:hypothetical protein ACP3BQ_005249 [Klebsiella pneumoniae]